MKTHTLAIFACLLVASQAAAQDEAEKATKEAVGVPKAMVGEWRVVKAERQGEAMPKELAERLVLKFTDSTFVLHRGEQVTEFALKFPETAGKPATFTMAAKDGNFKDQPGRVLYELGKDGMLTLCVPNRPDQDGEEPLKSFEDGAKSRQHIIMVLKKAAPEPAPPVKE